MLAAFTMVLSGTIVNVAVPDVMGAFGVGQSEVQLMSTAFMIAMTTGQLLNAWVVAVIGQRWGFVSTLALLLSAVLLPARLRRSIWWFLAASYKDLPQASSNRL